MNGYERECRCTFFELKNAKLEWERIILVRGRSASPMEQESNSGEVGLWVLIRVHFRFIRGWNPFSCGTVQVQAELSPFGTIP